MKKTVLLILLLTFIITLVYAKYNPISKWKSNAEGIYVLDSNVGIGTSSPSTTLDILGDVLSSDSLSITLGYFDFNTNISGGNSILSHLATAGLENEPMIFIDDNRVGTTSDETIEATMVFDTEGYYNIYLLDGTMYVATAIDFAGKFIMNANGNYLRINDSVNFMFGTSQDWWYQFRLNGANDDILTVISVRAATTTAAIWYSDNLGPTNNSDFNDYLSPTFIMINKNGADTSDFNACVIGARDESDVTAVNYFNFWAMTGAADGTVNGANTELPPTFMIGSSTSAVKTASASNGSTIITNDLQIGTSESSTDVIIYDVDYSTQAYKIEVISGILTATIID